MAKAMKEDSKKRRRKEDAEDEQQHATDEHEEAPASNDVESDEGEGIITTKSFSSLNIHTSLLSSIKALKWDNATRIQAASIPPALEGRDVIGLAETGSGKTGSFAIPILNYLLEKPQKQVFAVILAPTRELAFQINEVMVALGQGIGASSVCIVGGVDMASQAIALARNPHIVVATPGSIIRSP